MSLFAICMAAGTTIHYVGNASHGETTTPIPFPAGVAVGDLAIVNYLSDRSIAGGGWTVRTRGQLAVAFRVLTAGDISSPPNFSDVTNVITQVVRGPRSLSLERDGSSFTGSSVTLPGFVKTAGCLGFYAATSAESDDISVQSSPDIFTANSSSVGPFAFGLTSRVGLNPSLYVDGADFGVNATIAGDDKNAAIFEFLP